MSDYDISTRLAILARLKQSGGKLSADDLSGLIEDDGFDDLDKYAAWLESEYGLSRKGSSVLAVNQAMQYEQTAQLTLLLAVTGGLLTEDLMTGPSGTLFSSGKLDSLEKNGMYYKPGTGTAGGAGMGNTAELAKTSPVKIPENAIVKAGQKASGYDQVSYKWTDSEFKYEARWHTKTPGAPAGQGNTWVVTRVTRGTPTGQIRVEHILVGDTWVTRYEWQKAITAYQNGTMTVAQETMLKDGHWLVP